MFLQDTQNMVRGNNVRARACVCIWCVPCACIHCVLCFVVQDMTADSGSYSRSNFSRQNGFAFQHATSHLLEACPTQARHIEDEA